MTEYQANPLNANPFFGVGQVFMVILIVFTAILGLILLISRVAKLGSLEIIINRWFERFVLITLHTGLIWLGLSIVISYISTNVIDTIIGAVIISGTVVSIVRHATSDHYRANRALRFTIIFLFAMILLTFIFQNVLNALPATFRDSIADTFRPRFFKDLFSYWRWIQ